MEDEFEFEEETNNMPMDIDAVCGAFKQAWKTVPDQALGFALDHVFNGYDLKELSPEEIVEMLDEFVLNYQ